ncbi:transcription factor RelB isoform X2 [Melanotaenia boesemani]|uniref:transcription factor RelB isoform X2 n=1 Tax=Melanotaenia boesemani TaxID=1250792 RepID=UPI001C056087|nr:transcription factor RelB isoform X2 [Melanotaenia boesemani]
MKDMDIFNSTSEEPTPNPGIGTGLSSPYTCFSNPQDDLDLIESIIKPVYSEHQAVTLPGPPPPPPDLLSQSSCTQNHSTFQQSSSSTSQPLLVPRGSAPKPTGFPSGEMSSAYPSRVTPSAGRAPGSSSFKTPYYSQNQGGAETLEQLLDKPKLVVVEEPKDRGMRFRYECEGRSAGSILGASSTDTNKTQPTIEIQGPIDRLKRVTVTVSLVTKDLPHRPHPHCLVGKDCPADLGICVVSFNPHSNRRHSFANLGIQCVRRKEIEVSLEKRRRQNIDPFQTGHSKGIEDMDMNAVRLCFQCELEWEDGRKDSLGPVISKPVYDKKATTTSELKICTLNQYRGSCKGGMEVFMLCDKVQKDDIEILFKRESWKANGEFAQTDVHRQIAIVFKTPPYQDQDIKEEVEVKVVLRRVSDQMESESVTFTYLPHKWDVYDVKRKKATLKRDISFSDKSCATESASASDHGFCFFQDIKTMSPDERQHGNQAMLYSDLGDSDIDEETVAQLINLPIISNILSDPNLVPSSGFDPVPDINPTFSFASYPQDFAQYNDFQFNMLVNEIQNPQSELQEGMVQVKTEEEL